uniref:Uncharacterized protein n=1 Tax=Anopheles farauti TaxID=69004 RepID=A0A182QF14_9DIPT
MGCSFTPCMIATIISGIKFSGNKTKTAFILVDNVSAIMMHFFFLAAFFWLNTMCFNIWWTFRSERSGTAANEKGIQSTLGPRSTFFYRVQPASSVLRGIQGNSRTSTTSPPQPAQCPRGGLQFELIEWDANRWHYDERTNDARVGIEYLHTVCVRDVVAFSTRTLHHNMFRYGAITSSNESDFLIVLPITHLHLHIRYKAEQTTSASTTTTTTTARGIR